MSDAQQNQPEETRQQGEKMELYIWPHHWNLPSLDIDSLAATLYLQLAVHHHKASGNHPLYTLIECTDPDLSPSGTLPFLVHGTKKVGTFGGIVRHLEEAGLGLDEARGGDASLKRAKRVAWTSLVNSQLRDLVNHTLYANAENYRKGMHTAMVAVLPIPNRYYLPARLRASVQASLEPSGLWTVNEDKEVEKKHPFDKQKDKIVEEKDDIIRDAFGKEKALHKARDTFDLLVPLLKHSHSHSHHPHNHRVYFISTHPTALDTLIAAHILLLKHATLPNNPLLALLKESYQTILEHAERVLTEAFPNSDSIHGDIEVIQAPHANPVVQLGRSLGRVLQAVMPVRAG